MRKQPQYEEKPHETTAVAPRSSGHVLMDLFPAVIQAVGSNDDSWFLAYWSVIQAVGFSAVIYLNLLGNKKW